MFHFRDRKIVPEREKGVTYAGFLSKLRGRRVLPDLPHAILATMRGYIGGSYSAPLTGEAKQLGYYPLSSASDDEMRKIEDEMIRLLED